jgi:hypothetical protein
LIKIIKEKKMSVREDYYKFAHYLLPNTAFKNKKIFVDRAVNNPGLFIFGLKNSWKSIQVDSNQKKSVVPEFEVETKVLTKDHSLIIIKTPSAKRIMEAPLIGVIYDKEYNMRYFTYEIGKGEPGMLRYFLCEWTSDWKHINYGSSADLVIDDFIKGIEEQLVYEIP